MDNSKFDFEMDPEFSKNFYENIEKVLSEGDTNTEDLQSGEYTIKSEDRIDDEILNINASLAEQICEELDNKEEDKQSKHSKFPSKFKVPVGIVAGLLLLISFLGFTKPGNQLLLNLGVNIGGKIWAVWTNDLASDISAAEDTDHLEDEDLNADGPEADISKIIWPNNSGSGRKEAGVYNILLLGEEAIGSGSGRGRTDVMIIATLNTNTKEIKLTSLMRDLLVKIPGYKENKLNSVYEKDGIDLLYTTIAMNFDIHIDGAALVNFENFEKIIDELGGLELTLTRGEARYLNSTNYISNPAYRKVKEGRQILNGNQVLGYSRVRKRATITGNNNDYGRTDRHRLILNAIFDKYKTTSKVELASIMLKLLPMVSTDIDDKNFELLLNSFIEMGTMEMQQLRLPADKTFTDNEKVRGMFVLIPDYNKNIEILHDFIFGDVNEGQ
ncbi:MAG TPA: LCP family protein [Clostridiales bacterium]|nr:LCP family protein [Clostridiales bacterium]